MNGKTAKRLRREAGRLARVPKGVAYEAVAGSERKVPILSGSELDLQGKPKVIGVVQTATIAMRECQRSVYRAFKNVYITSKGKSITDALDAHIHRKYVGAITISKILNRA